MPAKKLKLPKKTLPALSAFALVFSLLGNLFQAQKAENNYEGELATKVFDGDTFAIESKQLIRLLGLDAPEMGACYAKEAKQKLEELVLNKKVILAEPLGRNNRILSFVYVDGVLINEILIKNGFALYLYQGGSATEALKAANDYARENHLGIFSPECYQPDPIDPKCVIKGNITDNPKRKLYFFPECPGYSQTIIERFMGEEYFCSEKEAKKAGYTKAKTCY